MESRFRSWTSRSQRLVLLLVLLVLGSLTFYFVTVHEDAADEFEDDYEGYRTELAMLTDQVQYWNMRNTKKPHPVHKERFFIWEAWSAGFNNRRISVELAFVYAWLTNRTLVLPDIQSIAPYYRIKPSYEELFEESDMRAGLSLMTQKEWKALPDTEKEEILRDNVTLLWKMTPNYSVFCWPKIPTEGQEKIDFDKWFNSRSNDPNDILDPYKIPDNRFHTARSLIVPEDILFKNWYYFFYLSDKALEKNLKRFMRDRLHFPNKVAEISASILRKMPKSFSSLHYRRTDHQFSESRFVTPEQVFNFTYDYFNEGEVIYVSTDENFTTFTNEFCPVFQKRYTIISLMNYSHYVHKMSPILVPQVEMLLATQGRVFVGTQYSTFSLFITRMRGYSKHVHNKSIFLTTPVNPNSAYVKDLTGWWNENPSVYTGIDDDEPEQRNVQQQSIVQ